MTRMTKREIAEMDRLRTDADKYEKEASRLRTLLSQRNREMEVLRSICGEAYQLAGAVDAPVKALDNFSAAAIGTPIPHDTFLPILDTDCGEIDRRTLAIKTAEEALDRLLKAAPYEGDLRLLMTSLKGSGLEPEDDKYATEYGSARDQAAAALAVLKKVTRD